MASQAYLVDVFADGYYADDGTTKTATSQRVKLRIVNTLNTSLNVGDWVLAAPYGTHYEAVALPGADAAKIMALLSNLGTLEWAEVRKCGTTTTTTTSTTTTTT